MSVLAILAPVFVLIALTFILLVWTGRERAAAVRRGDVRIIFAARIIVDA
jgi:hypothetical protein